MALARIWSIARLTKRAAPLITLSIAQHLTYCAILGQSRNLKRQKEYVEILSNVDLHVERSINIILRITLTLFSGH